MHAARSRSAQGPVREGEVWEGEAREGEVREGEVRGADVCSRGPAEVCEAAATQAATPAQRDAGLQAGFIYFVAGAVYAAIVLSIKLPEAHAALVPEWVLD